jgi:hypothetical protein
MTEEKKQAEKYGVDIFVPLVLGVARSPEEHSAILKAIHGEGIMECICLRDVKVTMLLRYEPGRVLVQSLDPDPKIRAKT